MAQIPETWPPGERSAAPRSIVVPIFPLPNVILFPGSVLPLHVFEDRYLRMIEDLLDRAGWIAMGSLRPQAAPEGGGPPPIHPVAGLGEIARHKRLADGRFLVWLVGVRRVRLDEVPSDRPYRLARAELLDEIAPAAEDARRLRSELVSAIRKRARAPMELGEQVPVGLLADVLLQCLALPDARKQDLFAELMVSRRVEAILSEHARLPLPPGDGG